MSDDKEFSEIRADIDKVIKLYDRYMEICSLQTKIKIMSFDDFCSVVFTAGMIETDKRVAAAENCVAGFEKKGA